MNVPTLRSSFFASALLLGLVSVLTVSCGEDSNPEAPDLLSCVLDTIPPASVTDLILKSPTNRSLVPVWKAPGDDGSKGTASVYDMRYSTSPITEQNWDLANKVDGEPAPKPAGQLESLPVSGLAPGTDYYFALKTLDEVSNESGLSNTATGRTNQEDESPSDVLDLVATAIDNTSFRLSWTAPGDDGTKGTASGYDIRYSTSPITDQNWNSAIEVVGEPSPKPYGQIETIDVVGLNSGTNYFFALKTVDDVPNWSGISNVAPGLEYNSFMWIYPDAIYTGETVNIVYRAPVGEPLTLSFTSYNAYQCGDATLKTLVQGDYPTGIYSLTYDFFNNNTGDYYSTFYRYYVSLCWGSELKAKIMVRLYDPGR